MEIEGSAIAVGIDAAVVANHHVVIRRAIPGGPGEVLEQFSVTPRLHGLERLSKHLAAYPGVVAVAEPTSMTWLPLAVALGRAGGALALVGNRHAARLRGALSAKNKSDVIDGEMLSRAGESSPLAQPASPTPPSWPCAGQCNAATRWWWMPTAASGGCCPRPAGPTRMCGRPSGALGPQPLACWGAGPISPPWAEPGRAR